MACRPEPAHTRPELTRPAPDIAHPAARRAFTLPLEGRVANMLLVATQFQSRDAGLGDPLELRLSQTDLADIAGISRQALGPILESLATAGVIALGYRSIRVLDPAHLQALVERGAVAPGE